MDMLIITTNDGVEIPLFTHLITQHATIRVDGDKNCRANGQDNYLVTIVNQARTKALSEKVVAGGKKVGEKIGETIVDEIKGKLTEQIIPFVLRAMTLEKVAGYVVHGLKVIGTAPVQVVLGVLGDAQEIGGVKEGAYRQPLGNGLSALIHWIGDPSKGDPIR